MLLVMAVTIFVDPIFAIMVGVIAANIVNAAQLVSLELDSLISTPLLDSTFSADRRRAARHCALKNSPPTGSIVHVHTVHVLREEHVDLAGGPDPETHADDQARPIIEPFGHENPDAEHAQQSVEDLQAVQPKARARVVRHEVETQGLGVTPAHGRLPLSRQAPPGTRRAVRRARPATRHPRTP